MASDQVQDNTRPASVRYLHVAMEIGWLLAAGLVPLAMASDGALLDPVQVPKVAVVRGIAIVLAALWAWEWGLAARPFPSRAEGGESVSRGPSRRIIGAAAAVAAATAISALASPLWHVGVWGAVPGSQSYGLYSTLCYFVIFVTVATHLRRREQLWRLLTVIALSSVAAGAYGIAQHFGVDPWLPSSSTHVRPPSTFGNPIMAGSFLLMALTLGVAVTLRFGKGLLTQMLLGVPLLAIPLTALLLTQSRGPWVGAAVALGVFVAIAAVKAGRRMAGRAVVLMILAAGVATVVSLLPTTHPGGALQTTALRASSIYDEVAGGGISGRLEIWRNSVDLAAKRPWVDGHGAPEVPGLQAQSLRWLVGYGPDTFRSTYPLAGAPQLDGNVPQSAHNVWVNVLVEQGVLGSISFALLFIALAVAGVALLRQARRGDSGVYETLALAGILGALAGRVVEQLVGLPNVADLMLLWLLMGMLAALPAVFREPDGVPAVSETSTVKPRPFMAPHRALPTALAVVLTLAGAALLWQANIRYVQGAALGAAARTAFERGDYQASVSYLSRAADAAPGVELYAVDQAIVLDTWRRHVDDPALQARLLRMAYGETQTALLRNPLSSATWAEAAKYSWPLARADRAMEGEAIRAHQRLTVLLPGYWVAHNALAAVYLEFGYADRSLAEAGRSLQVTGKSPKSAQALFLAGAAYGALGRQEQSVKALEGSLWLDPNHPQAEIAKRLLARLSASGLPGPLAEEAARSLVDTPQYVPGVSREGSPAEEGPHTSHAISTNKPASL